MKGFHGKGSVGDIFNDILWHFTIAKIKLGCQWNIRIKGHAIDRTFRRDTFHDHNLL